MIMAKDCKNVPKPHHYCMVMNWIFRLLFCTVFWCTKDKMAILCITHQICDFRRKTSPHQQSKLRCRSMAEETTFGQRMLFSQIRCPNTNEHKSFVQLWHKSYCDTWKTNSTEMRACLVHTDVNGHFVYFTTKACALISECAVTT